MLAPPNNNNASSSSTNSGSDLDPLLTLWLSGAAAANTLTNASSESLDDQPTLPDIFQALQRSFHCGNGSATFEQLISYVDISWWLDGVFQV